MRELALHILDIAENSISAGASQIRITIDEQTKKDVLEILIEDDGRGMSEEMLVKITDPFITSRTTRKVGLGIPFFKAAAEACNGCFTIQSELGIGTRVKAVFRHSHIDRMPVGDIIGTFFTLLIGTPEVHWLFDYKMDDRQFIFDDEPIKQTLDGISLTEPAVMKYIRESLEEGIQNVKHSESLIVMG